MSNPVLMSDFTKKLIEQQKQAQANAQNANQTQIQQQTLNTQASQQQNQNVQLDSSSATTEIKEPQVQQVEKTLPNVDMSAPKDTLDLSTKLEKAKKQNGLIEKVADKVKGLTGIGISSKSIEEKIKSGASEEEIAKDIKNYKRQQENTAQALVDMLICLGSVVMFAKAKNNTLLTAFKAKISGSGFGNKVNERMMATIGASIGAGYLGAIFKPMLLSLNRIGTEQYKVKKDENIDDDQYKILKNATRKEKANANFRNTISGALNGLATPLVTLGGGFVGAPLYVLFNSLNRYFVATKEDSGEKSVGSYVENLKGSPITNLVAAIPVLALAFKKGNYSAIYDKNLRKAFTNINNAGALESFSDGKTTYEKLAEVLKGSDDFRRITATDVDGADSLSGIMNRVSRYVSSDELADKMYNELSQNTFFLKILQIQEDESKMTEMLAQMFHELI